MKKKLVFLILGLLTVITVLTGGIYAWLTSTAPTGPSNFTVGEVKFEWTAPVVTNNPVVPGQNLFESGAILENKSNVATELRVIITYDVTGLKAGEVFNEAALIPTYDTTKWSQKQADGYYYYNRPGETVDLTTAVPILIPTEATKMITFFSGLKLDGKIAGNNYSGATITMTFTFEAKQADFVTWEELGTDTIDFGTGIKKP